MIITPVINTATITHFVYAKADCSQREAVTENALTYSGTALYHVYVLSRCHNTNKILNYTFSVY